MRILILVGLLLCCSVNAQAADPPAQVDQAEVLRLGNLVQFVGAGARGDNTVDAYVEALGPPASDADKWFISVVTMKGCPSCEQLKKDWSTSAALLALANPADPKQSWAQYNVYDKDDRSQKFRFESLKITSYPTILVQPPRSGKYGDPATVVFQGGYKSDPDKLAQAIAQSIRDYVSKLPAPKSAPIVGKVGQAQIGVDPPWIPTPRVDPLQPAPAPYYPSVDPQIPPAPAPVAPQPAPAVAFPWTTLLTLLAGGVSLPAAVALSIYVVQFVRARRQAEGKKLLLNDAAYSELLAVLKQIAQTPTPPPPATPTT